MEESTLFLVHEVDLAGTEWLHLKSALTWAPNVGFVASDPACPVLERALACLDGCEATDANRMRDPAVIVPRVAANVLALPGNVVFAHPDAAEAIRARGAERGVVVVDAEQPELARADGALTCCAVVLDPDFRWGPNY